MFSAFELSNNNKIYENKTYVALRKKRQTYYQVFNFLALWILKGLDAPMWAPAFLLKKGLKWHYTMIFVTHGTPSKP